MALDNAAGFLLSGTLSASGTSGAVIDNRVSNNYGYLYHSANAVSALVVLQASHNATAWVDVITVTAAAGAAVQISAYYPYLRARLSTTWSGAGATGAPVMYWQPGFA